MKSFNFLLSSQFDPLTELAHSWLASGATAFALWADNKLLASWPDGVEPARADLVEAVRVGPQAVGELRVTGMNDPAARQRLRAEAALIARLIPLERDLERMAEELVDTRDQLVALYSLAQVTRNIQDFHQILDRLVNETLRLARAEGAFLFIQPFSGQPIFASSPQNGWDLEFLQGAVDKVLAGGPHVSRLDPSLFPLHTIRGDSLILPVQSRGVERVVLGIVKSNAEYEAPDIKLGQAIAEFTGIHIDTCLMFQRSIEYTRMQTEMDLAMKVHSRLLPKFTPKIPGLDIGMLCLPARQVGGDLCDYVENPGQSFTFMIGDVSGKGVPASLLMAMTRTLIRKETSDNPLGTPEGILRLINRDLYADFTELGMFATVFIGQYDPNSKRLVYANAGHSPVYYYPAEGSTHLLIADGTPLGILPASQSEKQCIQIKPGDIFVVGTDGLIDTRSNVNEFFGYERLGKLIESLAHLPAQEIASRIVRAVNDFANNPEQVDDQTIFVLKCLP